MEFGKHEFGEPKYTRWTSAREKDVSYQALLERSALSTGETARSRSRTYHGAIAYDPARHLFNTNGTERVSPSFVCSLAPPLPPGSGTRRPTSDHRITRRSS